MGASGFQQWGITMTSASKVAFIAGFDLFLTPIFSCCIASFKKSAQHIEVTTWIAVFLSIFGIFLLSGATIDDMEVGMGETLTLISTVFWTLHITYTDIATNYIDTMSMMCVQMGFVTVCSGILAYFLEPQQYALSHMYTFFPWLLFLAVSEGLGFVLMALGQNVAPPTHAAIILSLEGVFAAVSSYLILGEQLAAREKLGCAFMLAATLLAEVGCPCLTRLLQRFNIGGQPHHHHHHGHSHSHHTNKKGGASLGDHKTSSDDVDWHGHAHRQSSGSTVTSRNSGGGSSDLELGESAGGGNKDGAAYSSASAARNSNIYHRNT
jgi:drug/metabolite transporter (DMT)-like permease